MILITILPRRMSRGYGPIKENKLCTFATFSFLQQSQLCYAGISQLPKRDCSSVINGNFYES